MKARTIIYWTATILTAASMAVSAEMYFTRNRTMMASFRKLGYPDYFASILGTFKLLGIAALLTPGRALLKEWAYAGFTFTFLGASASHAASGGEKEAAAPLVSLAILAASYLTRPANRQTLESPEV